MAGKKSKNIAYRWEDRQNKSGYSAAVNIVLPIKVAKDIARYVDIVEKTDKTSHVLIGIYPGGNIETGWNRQHEIDSGVGLTGKDLYQLLYDVIEYTKDEEKNGGPDK